MTTYDRIKYLSEQRGIGTNLVTLYIPNATPNTIGIASNKLNFELGTASNIKSKEIRKSVIEALKSASYLLKTYRCTIPTPSNLVLCTGTTISGQHI
jgi:peptide subunit release factor 1 (eRF1)